MTPAAAHAACFKDLKANFIIPNPPFNVIDWSGDLLRKDGRWLYGVPPAGNANFAWLQHFVHHLAPAGRAGRAGVVLAKGALTSKSSGEGDIRAARVQGGNLIDCIVNLPAKLFLNTQIPAGLWCINRERRNGFYPRKGEILFIDARNPGHLINRRSRELSADDIHKIAGTETVLKQADDCRGMGQQGVATGAPSVAPSLHEPRFWERIATGPCPDRAPQAGALPDADRVGRHGRGAAFSRHPRAGGRV